MKQVNHYIAYDERDRRHGAVSVRYSGLAYDEEHFKELAEQAKLDLSGHTIVLLKINVRNELRRPYKPYIIDLSNDEIYRIKI